LKEEVRNETSVVQVSERKKNGIKPNPQPDQLSGQFFDLITTDL
jgi:hypothetical protein